MITLKEWLEVVDYRITEGSDYTWNCYGNQAYSLTSWDGDYDGASFCITFDTRTQVVYEVQSHDYTNNRAYRIINPDYQQAYRQEAQNRTELDNQAWDDVNYVDLETDDDWIQKALAIKAGEKYDTRVSVPVEFTEAELLKYMTMAHERDITFNEFIEQALTEVIEREQLTGE